MRNQTILIFCLLVFITCTPSQRITKTQTTSISELKFLGEYDVPNGKQFKETTIGGLSGIDYDEKRDVYYLISDDRSAIDPARFYTVKIHVKESGIDSVEFVDVKSLLQKDGKVYPNSKQDPLHTPDPEDIRYNPIKDEIIWSSEGERIVKPGNVVLENPGVITIDRNGNYKDSFELPVNMHMHATENGPRQNSVFEGISFSDDRKDLFVSVEEPIYEDGPRAGVKDSTAWIRIIKFNAETKKPVAQFAYQIEPVAYPAIPQGAYRINGVSDILWIEENKLIIVERSFSTGRLSCTVRVFLANMNEATNIADINSLQSQPANPVSKKLLLNMDDLGRYIDNVEGVTLGPTLPNGHRTLIFVSDNNFSPLERTQFLLFEIIP